MKKLTLAAGLVLGSFLLPGCNKDAASDVPSTDGGITIEAFDASTRTSFGDDYSVVWTAGDKLALFNPAAQTPALIEFSWVSGNTFSFPGPAAGVPDGTYNAAYTPSAQYGALLPSNGGGNTLPAFQSQDCSVPKAHVAALDCMVGTAAFTSASGAAFAMKHLYALVEITLKNNTGAAAEIAKVTLNANTDLAGTVTIDNFATGTSTVVASAPANSGRIELTLTNGTIAAAGSLKTYVVVLPVAAYSGGMTLTAETTDGVLYSETRTVSGLDFAAGSHNTATFKLGDTTRSLLEPGDDTAAFLPDNEEQIRTVQFTAPEAWTVAVLATRAGTWLSVSPESGPAGPATLTIKADKNTASDVRNAAVTITSGAKTSRIEVKQDGSLSRRVRGVEFFDDGRSGGVSAFTYNASGVTQAGPYTVSYPQIGTMRLHADNQTGENQQYIATYDYQITNGRAVSGTFTDTERYNGTDYTDTWTTVYTYDKADRLVSTVKTITSLSPHETERFEYVWENNCITGVESPTDGEGIYPIRLIYAARPQINNTNLDLIHVIVSIYSGESDMASLLNKTGNRTQLLPSRITAPGNQNFNIVYTTDVLGYITRIDLGSPNDYILLTYED